MTPDRVAAFHGTDPVLPAERRRGGGGMPLCGSIEITFHAKQEMTKLDIVTSLNANNEFGGAAVEVVARNIQAAVGLRSSARFLGLVALREIEPPSNTMVETSRCRGSGPLIATAPRGLHGIIQASPLCAVNLR